MKRFGQIQELKLRDVFPREVQDFNPWLATREGLDYLGKALCLSLEKVETEVTSEDGRIDLVFREQNTENLIVIESQLGKGDHDHLGKMITYAHTNSFGARTAVWIANEFKEAHRKTVRDLNTASHSSSRFFAVQIRIFQINGSTPAPIFDVIAKPARWPSRRRLCISEAETAVIERLSSRFLEDFRTRFAAATGVKPQARVRGTNHMKIACGLAPRFELSVRRLLPPTVQASELRVQLDLLRGCAKTDLDWIRDRQGELGEPLNSASMVFDPQTEAAKCRIYVRRECDFADHAQWEKAMSWLIDNARAFYEQFPRLIDQLLRPRIH